QLTFIALPWFVLQTTGSATKTGLTGFAVALPAFAAGILGGAVVDRLGFKRASVVADVVSGIGIGLIPLLYHTVGLAFWQLLALVFLGALLEIPGLTARRSLLPELAALGGLRLEQINAAFESIQGVSLLLGPPVAGVLIARLGASDVLWLDAASFAASALIVGVAVPAFRLERPAAPGRYLSEIVAGLRFLRRDRLLRALAISLALSNFLEAPLVAVLLPVYVSRLYGRPTVLGLLVAAFGVGSLAGAALFGVLGHRLPRRTLWVTGYLVVALCFWALAAMPPLPVLLGALAVTGVAAGPLNPLLVTIRHERTPPELRGRVFSTFSAVSQLAIPVGMLVVGSLLDRIGLRPTTALIAAGSLTLALGMRFVPALRELDRRQP
ncbi:MAG: MFS transporter, partial [Thermomicrobiaceae bacterium]|nr:MFS transporter [Thermomicrobiaceae bacterium]